MLLHYGLIKVLRVEAYMECTIMLLGVGEQRYPLSRLGDRCYDPFFDHVIEGALKMFPVLDGDLNTGCVGWGES